MKRATVCWAAAAMVIGLLTLFLLGYGINSSPALRVNPADLTEAAEQVIGQIVSGDYETLSSLLYGAPNLGTPPAEGPEAMIWKAFHDSIQYEIPENAYVLDAGAAMDLDVTCLDLSALTASLQQTAPKQMAEKANALGDDSLIYDASHNYREDFLRAVMEEAAAQVLAGQPQTVEQVLTLQFVRADGRWQVVPTGELLQFLSGFPAD